MYFLLFLIGLISRSTGTEPCLGENQSAAANQYKCWNTNGVLKNVNFPVCVPLSARCDPEHACDCPWCDDEWNCPTFKECEENGGFLCANSFNQSHQPWVCIPETWKCDGVWDCPAGEDEGREFCDVSKCANNNDLTSWFQCNDTGRCIPTSDVGNGQIDCVNGEDEDPDVIAFVKSSTTLTMKRNRVLTLKPTVGLTLKPTVGLTMRPTEGLTMKPTPALTMKPTAAFTLRPTPAFTLRPTPVFTLRPTPAFTLRPTPAFTLRPTPVFTLRPTPAFTLRPTPVFTLRPTPAFTLRPTPAFTLRPTPAFTLRPTPAFTLRPTPAFTMRPTPARSQPLFVIDLSIKVFKADFTEICPQIDSLKFVLSSILQLNEAQISTSCSVNNLIARMWGSSSDSGDSSSSDNLNLSIRREFQVAARLTFTEKTLYFKTLRQILKFVDDIHQSQDSHSDDSTEEEFEHSMHQLSHQIQVLWSGVLEKSVKVEVFRVSGNT